MTELSEVTAETVGLSWLINDISRTTCFEAHRQTT